VEDESENILPSVAILGVLSGLGELTIPKECYNKFCWQGIVYYLVNVTLSSPIEAPLHIEVISFR
jgi:hypothetical protein